MTQAAYTAAPAATPAKAKPKFESAELHDAICECLRENKAEDIISIDLRGRTSIGDYMVIACGRSSRQVVSLSEHLSEMVKQQFNVIPKIEGKEMGDWVLLDTGDVIVHIFRPEVREFYQIEKMWMPID